MLRLLTAGESHGRGILALVDGFPAGLEIDPEAINAELARRQGGYGRGARQKLETDRVDILTGVWNNLTLGGPIALWIENKDYKLPRLKDIDRPRPGHGDLAGWAKYLGSIRGVLERASARETAAKVAAGALAKQLLAQFGIHAVGYVIQLGPVKIPAPDVPLEERIRLRDQSQFYTLDPSKDPELIQLVDQCRQEGDTLGGIIEVRVEGLPFGLGTHTQWDRKLDGRLAQALMAIQAIKGVEIGLGFRAAELPGSKVHDPIQFDPRLVDTPCAGFVRPTNNAGGLEAGMTNTQPIVIRAAKKPISTLARALPSVNLTTKQPEKAAYERSDVCAVPAASVVCENVVAFEIARALVEKFGADSVQEMKARWDLFYQLLRKRLE